jgi:hypothetical protein
MPGPEGALPGSVPVVWLGQFGGWVFGDERPGSVPGQPGQPGPLTAAGFDPTRRAAWPAEGLLIYLTADEAERLLTTITGIRAAGSRLAFEHNPAGRQALTATAARIPAMTE